MSDLASGSNLGQKSITLIKTKGKKTNHQTRASERNVDKPVEQVHHIAWPSRESEIVNLKQSWNKWNTVPAAHFTTLRMLQKQRFHYTNSTSSGRSRVWPGDWIPATPLATLVVFAYFICIDYYWFIFAFLLCISFPKQHSRNTTTCREEIGS